MTQTFVEHIARLHPSYSRKSFETASTFRQVYLNPSYGWEFACDCADARVKFPIGLKGRDQWLFRAYMMRLNPADFHIPHVEEAFLISRDPIKSRALKALLIAGLEKPVDEHLRLVVEKTGYAKRVVEAFEILFFNVLDRPEMVRTSQKLCISTRGWLSSMRTTSKTPRSRTCFSGLPTIPRTSTFSLDSPACRKLPARRNLQHCATKRRNWSPVSWGMPW